ncbi:MAG: choice-of-anchor Q domain-containing protein [Kiritimatiellia bacterium]
MIARVSTTMIIFTALILFVLTASAADLYVALDGSNDFAGKYGTWRGAATNIQDAVHAAANGDTVRVSRGTYYLAGQVSITGAVTVRSQSGNYADTVINGSYPAVTSRCFRLNHSNAVLEGFTITNGSAQSTNRNAKGGGGVLIEAGTLRNCLVTGNSTTNAGGGVHAIGAKSIISNCDVVGNALMTRPYVEGGGAKIEAGAQMMNCRVMFNHQTDLTKGGSYGAGMVVESGAMLCNSVIVSNILPTNINPDFAGGVYLKMNGVARNCLITGNGAFAGGGIGIVSGGLVQNCTVSGNTAGYVGAGVYVSWNKQIAWVCNTISYPDEMCSSGGTLYATNCCVRATNNVIGTGMMTNKPHFTDAAGGNFRLAPGSPCIGAGVNQDWMCDYTDIEGTPRICPASGRVDLGCYEAK